MFMRKIQQKNRQKTVDKHRTLAYNHRVKGKIALKGSMLHYPQPFREGAAKLQGTRCGQGSAAPELPKKSDVCAALRRTKAAGCTACNLGGTTEVIRLSPLCWTAL